MILSPAPYNINLSVGGNIRQTSRYGIQLLTADTYEERFILGLVMESIKGSDETKNI
jgi:hypothetical protein